MCIKTNNTEELMLLKEITGVCPLVIYANRLVEKRK